MEDDLLNRPDAWTADYTEGTIISLSHKDGDGVTWEWRNPAHWTQESTGRRITNEEMERALSKGSAPTGYPTESFKFDFIDFSKHE